MAPKTIMAPKVQAAIKGQPWTGETLKKALQAVAEDVNITPNAPGISQLTSSSDTPSVLRMNSIFIIFVSPGPAGG